MRPSRTKAKLQRGEPVLVVTLHLTDPSIYELVSLMGFDCIWMDMEHHFYSVETAAQLMRAARVGVADVLARPAKGEFMRMGRMLEAGAQGIMYPRCDGPAEAAEAVRWAKFAPQGTRGCDAANPDNPYLTMPVAEYVAEANRQTFLVVQIEDSQSLELADQIAAVDGVDVLFLGPGDFSILSGVPGQFDHPCIQQAVEKVARAAEKAGKHWGCPAFSVDHTRQLIDRGARFIAHSADVLMVKAGMEQLRRDFAPLGFTFDDSRLPGA
jgi:4-hydroxy-2-oxoheptanedioate aldolase